MSETPKSTSLHPDDETTTTAKNIGFYPLPYSSTVSRFHNFVVYFSGYFIFVLIVIGLIGNLVSIIIFVKLRRKVIFSTFYFLYLAVFDTLALCAGIQLWMDDGAYAMLGQDTLIWEAASSNHCIVIMYVWTAFGLMSSWTLVMFSVDRTLAIWKALWITKVTYLKKIVLGIVIASSFVFALGVVPLMELEPINERQPERQVCRTKIHVAWHLALSVISIILFYSILPLIGLLIVDVALVYGLYKRDHGEANDPSIMKAKRYYDWQVAMTLFAVSTLYVVTMVPFCVAMTTYLVDEYYDWPGRNHNYKKFMMDILEFSHKMCYVCFSSKFIIYLFSLDFYRIEWANLLMCCCPGKVSTKKPGAYGLYVVTLEENGTSGGGRFTPRGDMSDDESTTHTTRATL
jgi:hypothetical protein